jgi:hypothetical protein
MVAMLLRSAWNSVSTGTFLPDGPLPNHRFPSSVDFGSAISADDRASVVADVCRITNRRARSLEYDRRAGGSLAGGFGLIPLLSRRRLGNLWCSSSPRSRSSRYL